MSVASVEAVREETTSPPLLFFKVGVLGALPLRAMGALADTYDATYFSSDETRLELIEKRENRGVPTERAQQVDTSQVRDIVVARSIAALENDEDVMLDTFFNTANSRRVPLRIAQQTGAKTVALWLATPTPIAVRRTTEWAQHDAFTIPMSRWDTPPARIAERMSEHVEMPSKKEGIDYIFTLHGIRNDTDMVLEEFETRLTQTGLIDRYEEAE
ncbi:MAG TPA: hypothetical protein VHB72_03335 [Candidatus Saccharimonadales bacterium]|nr:hypothetical protein [Candidatus Saccharimonadales bacterium]